MEAKLNHHLVLPKCDTSELLALSAKHGFLPDLRNARALAQTMADDEDEPYLIVKVIGAVNPTRTRSQD